MKRIPLEMCDDTEESLQELQAEIAPILAKRFLVILLTSVAALISAILCYAGYTHAGVIFTAVFAFIDLKAAADAVMWIVYFGQRCAKHRDKVNNE